MQTISRIILNKESYYMQLQVPIMQQQCPENSLQSAFRKPEDFLYESYFMPLFFQFCSERENIVFEVV